MDGEARVMGGRVDMGADEFTDRAFVFGDLNCDGVRDGFDIEPFFFALGNPEAYALAYPDCEYRNGDVNADGATDGFDIDPFFAFLQG
jgi:hypothetical protein